jgi:hypothetical protein
MGPYGTVINTTSSYYLLNKTLTFESLYPLGTTNWVVSDVIAAKYGRRCQ